MQTKPNPKSTEIKEILELITVLRIGRMYEPTAQQKAIDVLFDAYYNDLKTLLKIGTTTTTETNNAKYTVIFHKSGILEILYKPQKIKSVPEKTLNIHNETFVLGRLKQA